MRSDLAVGMLSRSARPHHSGSAAFCHCIIRASLSLPHKGVPIRCQSPRCGSEVLSSPYPSAATTVCRHHEDRSFALAMQCCLGNCNAAADCNAPKDNAACSRAGPVAKGCEYFKLMTAVCGVKPRMGHYSFMVELFGQAGNP